MELTLIPNNTPENVLNTQITLGKISFDVELIKNTVKSYLSKYDGLVVQEEDIKNIKSEVAFLRKQKTLINKNRIELSKKFDEPLIQYKEDCDSVMDVIEDTITYLNNQLNDFEQRRKDEKRQQVEDLMDKVRTIKHMPDDFEFIFEDRFLNATLTIKKIQEELIEQCNQYEIMKKLEKEMEEKIKAKKLFLEDIIIKLNENLDPENKMRYTDYENVIEEVEIDELEEYMLNEFRKYLDKQMTGEGIEKEILNSIEEKQQVNKQEELKTYSIKVYDISTIQLEQVRNLLQSMNIDYRIDLENKKENDNFYSGFDICA